MMAMKIPLHERVAAHVGKQRSQKSGEYLSSFIALRNEISEALDKGWSLKAVWQTLHDEGEIKFRYVTFTRYVVQVLGEAYSANAGKDKSKKQGAQKEKLKERPAGRAEIKKSSTESQAQTFKFDPNRNLEDFT